MRILYITPKINNEGGVARVLSVKTNYIIEKLGYEVAICTQNCGNEPLFFDFNSKVKLFDTPFNGSFLDYLSSYKKNIQTIIENYKPDCLVVTDNGIKGFLFQYLIKSTIPVLFEVHGSKFNSQNTISSFFSKMAFQTKLYLKQLGLKKFEKVIFLSQESASEWNVSNFEIIPNSNWIQTEEFCLLEAKRVLCIARNSYEKGLDILIQVWKEISEKQPNWKLELITESKGYFDIEKMIVDADLSDTIELKNSQKNIVDSYLNSSIYLMTSRDEGLPMVLIEALSVGLPVIAFDCPIGPKALIENDFNGYLIENKNTDNFIEKTLFLIENQQKRVEFGKNGILSTKKFDTNSILEKWKQVFESLKTRR